MGQQQVLLVILVTIIAGIATVVAIGTFSRAAETAAMDAVRQDVANIAASAQGYYMKPKILGGGGNSFDGLDFTKIVFAKPGQIMEGRLKAASPNGEYTIAIGSDAASLTVTAVPANGLAALTATIEADRLSWAEED